MIKKITIGILSILILVEGIYVYKLYSTLQEKRNKIGDNKSDVTFAEQTINDSQQVEKSDISSATQKQVTVKKVEDKFSKQLQKKYKKPLDEIIAAYQDKIAKNPKDLDSHYELAYIYKHLASKRQAAIKHLKVIQDTNAEYAKKKNVANQIKILQLMNKNTTARKKFVSEAYDLWHDRRKNWSKEKIGAHFYKIAKDSEKRNFFSAAEINYRKALRFDPKNEKYHFEYAKMVKNRSPKTSLFHFEKILSLNTKSVYRSQIHEYLSQLKTK